MNSLDILVYDDIIGNAREWAKRINETCPGAAAVAAGKADFQKLLKLINSRRKAWRESDNTATEFGEHPIDTADVVVVDYDLLQYSDTTDTTGSRLAYLLRCFSQCGFIIILNEYGRNVFDLSLRTPTLDFADIHLGNEQLGNPGLWQFPFNGYRPWYWPVVPSARENFEACVRDVQDNLEKPILEFLALDKVIDWLPRGAREFLTGKKKLEKVTFEDFVESARGGISARDMLIPGQIARVAAARIITLLNLEILPEQSVLVDAPHLVSRFPSLLSNGSDAIENWDMLCNPVSNKIDALLLENLKPHKYQKDHWLWRPAWYWPDINKDEEIREVSQPWTFEEPDWVFCEDISRFVPLEVAQDFTAIVSPPFIKRYIFKSDVAGAIDHVGRVRQGGPSDPSLVEFVPEVALSW